MKVSFLKIVVVSLPKTGTSTLAVMLRVLGYEVTGPNKHIKDDKRNIQELKNKFNGFQDYPWCFEYQSFNINTTLFIYIERDNKAWVNSFIYNYGRVNGNHYCQSYWKGLKNTLKNKQKLIDNKKQHKKIFLNWAKTNNAKVLYTNLKSLTWEKLCVFTNNDIPKNIFGKVIEVPNVNSSKYKYSKKYFKLIRNFLSNFIHPNKLSRLRNKLFKITGKRI